jgi:manganese/iron transport system ATP-binding protein
MRRENEKEMKAPMPSIPVAPADPLTAAISIQSLQVRYRMVQALQDISAEIPVGHLIGIIGPNGAGKSTLLKAMLGLIPTLGGRVLYRDRPLHQQLDRVAYVPQRSLIDWTYPATVWDVVMMGRVRKTGWLRPFTTISRTLAEQALERVGMSAYLQRPIGQLSGGQQQRVFLARSLAQQAEIYIFDEPFVGIDQKTEEILFQIFRELAAAGQLVLVVNHDLGESIQQFDRLLLLNQELIAYGLVDQVLQPENMYRAYGGKVLFHMSRAA